MMKNRYFYRNAPTGAARVVHCRSGRDEKDVVKAGVVGVRPLYLAVAICLFVFLSMAGLNPAHGLDAECWEERVEINSRLLENDPEDIDAAFNLALAHANTGEISRAMDKLEKVRSLDSGGEYAREVIRESRALLEDEPEDELQLNRLGFALFAEGSYEEATSTFETIVEIEPENVWARNNLVITYLQLEEYEKALENLKKNLEREPDNEYIHFLLGYTYYRQGNYLGALSQLYRARGVMEKYFSDQF